jgi:hypothetical protein
LFVREVSDSPDPDEREPAPAGYDLEHMRSRLRISEMPPERYVALYAHEWMLFGPLVYRFPDPEVDAHVRRVYELMKDRENLGALRREWLTSEEFARVRQEEEAMNDPDYDF